MVDRFVVLRMKKNSRRSFLDLSLSDPRDIRLSIALGGECDVYLRMELGHLLLLSPSCARLKRDNKTDASRHVQMRSNGTDSLPLFNVPRSSADKSERQVTMELPTATSW